MQRKQKHAAKANFDEPDFMTYRSSGFKYQTIFVLTEGYNSVQLTVVN
jgi:hypothetical protein